jgi:hypothetical protein
MNGDFGKTLQEISYAFVVAAVICLSVFGIPWGVHVVLSACVWSASELVYPLFRQLQHIDLNLAHHVPPAGHARITARSG